ncbi:Enhancer of mRNA-decapping protein 4 [Operophtera brumata]|uniref:Enhancer of mRNA-decapping protein 4 n=1 Tax=Operophtera brumata TaxID=104452 RepID=A0A0L7KSY3_OPEBR|nr:Enhancer of mRNA-decapping protein 4 [Operophtera brumata]
MVQATAESVKDVIGSCLSRDISALYLPILEHSHRRLLRHVARVVEGAFTELEEYSGGLAKSVYKISKLLSKEMKLWRQKVLDTFSAIQKPVEEFPEPPNLDCIVALEISKQLERGDVNSAFEQALGAADLSLVMAACHGATAHGSAFAPRCHLRQHVLLALLQQLSTDMLHDTQLKCRYLEDAIINLDPANPATRAHLPLVVGEVRKHLSKFLAAYPSHAACRRMSLIIMAADNLLK